MTAQIYQLRDFHLRRMEQEAKQILAEALDSSEIAKLGGPVIPDTAPCEYPGGIDDLPVA